MVPWIDYQDILNRQQSYDGVRFRNEVLGLPTDLGDHLITREEIEACCDDRPFAQSRADVPGAALRLLVAGLDWGGGGFSRTVLVLGYIERNRVFRVVRFDRWEPYAEPDQVLNEIATRCRQFQVRFIAADGGGMGRSNNRLLLTKMRESGQAPNFHSIFYGSGYQNVKQDGALWRWTVDRSDSIGTLFGRIKKGLLRFPSARQCGSFLDEFLCEVAQYDPKMRSVTYTKPDNLRDDALHATNYAELLGLRIPPSEIG